MVPDDAARHGLREHDDDNLLADNGMLAMVSDESRLSGSRFVQADRGLRLRATALRVIRLVGIKI